MQAGTTGKAFNFWLVDTIAPDQKTRNWYTGEETTVESKTSQRYFVDNLNGAAAGDTVNLYINSVGGSVKEALGIYSTLRRCPATVVAYRPAEYQIRRWRLLLSIAGWHRVLMPTP